jgi:hypothetical protein
MNITDDLRGIVQSGINIFIHVLQGLGKIGIKLIDRAADLFHLFLDQVDRLVVLRFFPQGIDLEQQEADYQKRYDRDYYGDDFHNRHYIKFA